MPLIATETGGGPKQLVPPGTHVARCYSVIDLGTQQGQFGPKRKIRISWELPEEKAVFKEERGPEPFSVHSNYTLSLNEKATLRHHLESWRGRAFTADELKGFDILNLVGAPCLLSVIHKTQDSGKTYANVQSISPLARGMVCPPQVNAAIKYDISQGQSTTYMALPEFLRKVIAEADEWDVVTSNDPPEAHPTDNGGDDSDELEIPF